jgi:hypothetical protein
VEIKTDLPYKVPNAQRADGLAAEWPARFDEKDIFSGVDAGVDRWNTRYWCRCFTKLII